MERGEAAVQVKSCGGGEEHPLRDEWLQASTVDSCAWQEQLYGTGLEGRTSSVRGCWRPRGQQNGRTAVGTDLLS